MVFGGCKSQIFIIGDQNVGHGDRLLEAWKRSKSHGDSFVVPGGHSATMEAWRLFLQASCRLCTPLPF